MTELTRGPKYTWLDGFIPGAVVGVGSAVFGAGSVVFDPWAIGSSVWLLIPIVAVASVIGLGTAWLVSKWLNKIDNAEGDSLSFIVLGSVMIALAALVVTILVLVAPTAGIDLSLTAAGASVAIGGAVGTVVTLSLISIEKFLSSMFGWGAHAKMEASSQQPQAIPVTNNSNTFSRSESLPTSPSITSNTLGGSEAVKVESTSGGDTPG